MKRARIMALLGAAALVGCQNMGLDYAGPEDEARHAPPMDLVAAVTQPTASWGGQELVVDGRLWVPWGITAVRETNLRPVGSAGGMTAHARSWDAPPYDALFTRLSADAPGAAALATGDRWLSHAPVIGGGGRDRPRSEDGAGH